MLTSLCGITGKSHVGLLSKLILSTVDTVVLCGTSYGWQILKASGNPPTMVLYATFLEEHWCPEKQGDHRWFGPCWPPSNHLAWHNSVWPKPKININPFFMLIGIILEVPAKGASYSTTGLTICGPVAWNPSLNSHYNAGGWSLNILVLEHIPSRKTNISLSHHGRKEQILGSKWKRFLYRKFFWFFCPESQVIIPISEYPSRINGTIVYLPIWMVDFLWYSKCR